jgi:hypothetical protein
MENDLTTDFLNWNEFEKDIELIACTTTAAAIAIQKMKKEDKLIDIGMLLMLNDRTYNLDELPQFKADLSKKLKELSAAFKVVHTIISQDALYVEFKKGTVIYHFLEEGNLREKTLKCHVDTMLKLLPEDLFTRIHRKFVVAEKFVVERTDCSVILVHGIELPRGSMDHKGTV